MSIRTFVIEGTGPYGADLSRFLNEGEKCVFEIDRSSRQPQRQTGEDAPTDAENAACYIS
ncbi:hypothetical protein [Muricoccus radiodurans]|uniref:hypothetical protein n=1 Tax=Muricoccus radiodurans TaxID=2231721 RepID=UPI003CE71A4C